MAGLLVNTCPNCGAEEALELAMWRAIGDDETSQLICDVVAVSAPLGPELIRYARLHKPPKHKLTVQRLHAVFMELVPAIRRSSLEHGGRVIVTPQEAWRTAFQAVFAAADRGSLRTPLTTHAYLYGVLTTQADRAGAAAEEQRDLDLRRGLRGGPAQPAQADSSSPAVAPPPAPSAAAPMPDAVRAYKAGLKRPTPADGPTNPPAGAAL